jgi:3'-5' exonuclease
LDIETVSQTYAYEDLDEKTKGLFDQKNRFAQNHQKSFEMLYNEKGAILSEFGKIICISVGFVQENSLGRTMRLKSFAHDDEETLLKQFKSLIETRDYLLCGHNSKEFDIPYICRRMLVNGIVLPPVLDIAGKKPQTARHQND